MALKTFNMNKKDALINYCLRLGDSSLILGQRMAEWCSNAHIIEEDIAMSNLALDFIGQARTMLSYAGETEGKGRTEDDFSGFRNEREFYNTLLSERPNGHFGDTVARNFLHDLYFFHLYTALTKSSDTTISAHAEKSLKEVQYHVRHSSEWMIRLGDGTEESHEKIQSSLNDLWEFTGDLFEMNDVDEVLIKEGIATDMTSIKSAWSKSIDTVLERAKLTRPSDGFMHTGRLNAIHSEHLGHLLCEMQYLQRSYPEAKW